MMKYYLIVGLCTLSWIMYAEDGKLPIEAEELSSKLNAWETEEQQAFDKRLREKRIQVAEALKVHLEKATKNGDLDGALAIRRYIDSLTQGGEPSLGELKPVPEPSTNPPTDQDFRDWLETVEFHFAQANITRYFEDDQVFTKGQEEASPATIKGNVISYVWGGDGETPFTFTVHSKDRVTSTTRNPAQIEVEVRPRSRE